MQFPESWLRSFCNPDLSTQQLADLLTMAGLEVEELQPVAPAFTGVVVAQVLEVAKHPDADRLNVCKVDAGIGEVLQIVCGAPNVRPGIKIPCATVGAELPPGAPGGSSAPTVAHGILMPGRTLGAPQTICSTSPMPASTLHTFRRSASGCLATSSTCATTTPVKAGATGCNSSTSRPAMVSRSASCCVLRSGLQKLRSQDSGNCMSGILGYLCSVNRARVRKGHEERAQACSKSASSTTR